MMNNLNEKLLELMYIFVHEFIAVKSTKIIN